MLRSPSYVDAVTDTLCRLTVLVAGPNDAAEADLVLPTECPLGTMLPSIVEAVVGPASTPLPVAWHASRLAGQSLDPSSTLQQSGIADGDVIVLSMAEVPAPQRIHGDTCAAVLAEADPRTAGWDRAGPGIGLVGCVAGAATLAWSGVATATPAALWVSVGLAIASAAAALADRSGGATARVSAALAAVAFAAAAGSLAVPRAPAPATVLLAASAALMTSTAMLRTACRGSASLATVVTAAVGVTAISTVCTVASPPIEVLGSVLAVTAVAALSLAPKLVITVTKIGPAHRVDGIGPAAAHDLLTNVVAGAAMVAVLGCAMVGLGAATRREAPTSARVAAVLLAVDIGLLLLLRRRVHADARRRAALGMAGVAALGAALGAAASTAPANAYWFSAATGAAGLVAISARPVRDIANPVLRQSVQLTEYGVSAAVVPLAAWAGGLYDVVRHLGLP